MATFVTVTADPSAAADDVSVSDSPVSAVALALNQNFNALSNRIGKCNYTASGVPAVSNDNTQGYSVGSRWLYLGAMYECSDASTGAAVWTAYTGAGSVVRATSPTVTGLTVDTIIGSAAGSDVIVSPTNMTSDSAPSPYASSASSVFDTPYNAWHAFDGNASDFWSAASGHAGWLKMDLGVATKVSFYEVGGRAGLPGTDPKSWTFEGSDDGSTWTTLDTVASESAWTGSESHRHSFTPAATHRYYRLNISDTQDGVDTPCVSQLIFGYTASSGLEIDSDQLTVGALPAYASNTLALAGGLTAGMLYRNGDNLCVVH